MQKGHLPCSAYDSRGSRSKKKDHCASSPPRLPPYLADNNGAMISATSPRVAERHMS